MVNEQEVLEVIRKAMKDKTITFATLLDDVGDSLQRLDLLMALDEFFKGATAGMTALAYTKTVREIIELLRKQSLVE